MATGANVHNVIKVIGNMVTFSTEEVSSLKKSSPDNPFKAESGFEWKYACDVSKVIMNADMALLVYKNSYGFYVRFHAKVVDFDAMEVNDIKFFKKMRGYKHQHIYIEDFLQRALDEKVHASFNHGMLYTKYKGLLRLFIKEKYDADYFVLTKEGILMPTKTPMEANYTGNYYEKYLDDNGKEYHYEHHWLED